MLLVIFIVECRLLLQLVCLFVTEFLIVCLTNTIHFVKLTIDLEANHLLQTVHETIQHRFTNLLNQPN